MADIDAGAISGFSSVVPINSVIPFNVLDDKYNDIGGDSWLKSGVVDPDYRNYPNATKNAPFSTGDTFNISAQVSSPNAISVESDFAYVIDYATDLAYKYNLDFTYTGQSFDISVGGMLNQCRGATIYNGFRYLLDGQTSIVYKFNLDFTYANESYDLSSFITTSNQSKGISNNGSNFFIANSTDDKVYVFNNLLDSLVNSFDVLSSPQSVLSDIDGFFASSLLTSSRYSLDGLEDITLIFSTGSTNTTSLCYGDDGFIYSVGFDDIVRKYNPITVGMKVAKVDSDSGLPIYTRIK